MFLKIGIGVNISTEGDCVQVKLKIGGIYKIEIEGVEQFRDSNCDNQKQEIDFAAAIERATEQALEQIDSLIEWKKVELGDLKKLPGILGLKNLCFWCDKEIEEGKGIMIPEEGREVCSEECRKQHEKYNCDMP